MKIAHEAPISIFPSVQRLTDYDYALVHLFESNPIYWNHFRDAVINGREVILDNSIFELGTAFDSNKYYHWINKLLPTWYIIPDVLEDCEGTINSLNNWLSKYNLKDTGVKSIGVIQGKTYDELVRCYKEVEPKVDKVAISFDYSYYVESSKNLEPMNKYAAWMFGRQKLLFMMQSDGIINESKPHHLLGCGLPQEFMAYKHYKWIDSVDTSNPVVHGLNNVRYTTNGLTEKISTKLIEYISEEVSVAQLKDIEYNIQMFRGFCN